MQSRFCVHTHILYTYTPPHDNCICARYKISFFFSPIPSSWLTPYPHQARKHGRDERNIGRRKNFVRARVREPGALRGNRVRHEPSSSPRRGVLAEKNKLLSKRFTVENVVQEFHPAGDRRRYVNAKITDNNVHLYERERGKLENGLAFENFGFAVEQRINESDFSRF